MLDWLTDPFAPEFMQRALLAGLLAAFTCALIGTWVVIRGFSFLGEALSHGVLPGIALAELAGVDVTIGAAVGAAVMVVGVNGVTRSGRVGHDAAIGLLFVGMLGLGVIIVSRSSGSSVDLTAVLFGDILGVDGGDLALQAVIAAVVALGVVVLHRALLVLAFNDQKAALLGLRPRLSSLLLLALVALSITASYRTVGTLLVVGLLVAPPAAASLLVRRVPAMLAVAVLLGFVAVFAGLVVSYHADLASGASIAVAAVVLFFAVLAVRTVGERLADRQAAASGSPA